MTLQQAKNHLSNEKNSSGLGLVGEYTTYLCGGL